MKKTLIFLITLMMALSFAACTDTGNNDVVIPEGIDTPNLVGETTFTASLAWMPQLTEGGLEFGDSDIIIADVTITGWLDELHDYVASFFSAKVNKVLYGNLDRDTIVVSQSGTSKETMEGRVLMDQGERLILIISEKDEIVLSDIRDAFEADNKAIPDWVKEGVAFTARCGGALSIIEHEGVEYVLDKYGIITEPVASSKETIPHGDALRSTLVEKAKSKDPAFNSLSYPRAYKYDDFVSFVEEYAP